MWLTMWKATVSVFTLVRVTHHLGVLARDTVPEVLYEPPVPQREQPRQVVRQEACCPEPHCCSVQKTVLKSQAAAEGELAKGVHAAAALGGTQADYRRATAENALRRAEEDKYASAAILDANVEKDVRVAEADAAAVEKELEELREKDKNLEQRHRMFAERAIAEVEGEATQAEVDLRSLEKERRNLADLVMEHEVEEAREDNRAALAQQEAAVSDSRDAAGKIEDKGLAAQIENVKGEVKAYESQPGGQQLAQEARAAEERARSEINHARRVLAHARGREKNAELKPAYVDTTGDESVVANVKEHEDYVTAAEHEAEVQKEENALAQLVAERTARYPVLHFRSVPATAHAQADEMIVTGSREGNRMEAVRVGY